jgi:decaprenylphospho-beta-D-erythro-pentofuranosid-2-ulose 2-reductase
MSDFSTAVVIGASAGIGELMVKKLAAEGTKVAAVARRRDRLDAVAATSPNVHAYVHDVRDFDAAAPLWDRIVADLGDVDLVVYNAGVMPRVDEGEYNWDKDREMLEVNLLGAVRWLDLAAAHMEARRKGTICGISSVAGDRGRRLNPVYNTSKAGLTCYLEALRNRCSRYGVTVVTVKPGPVATDMTKGLKLPLMISAEEAADGALAMMKRGTSEGYVPAVWGPIMTVVKNVPSVVFRKTNI